MTRWLVRGTGAIAERRVVVDAAAAAASLPGVRRLAAAAAGARRRSLILLYHRVVPEGRRPWDIVPAVTPALLREQIEHIGRIADLVPLAALLESSGSGAKRPRVAITFDDDHPSHAEHALPVLTQLRAPATFFLSGRALHRLPDYWWSYAEHALAEEGAAAIASRLGISGDIADIARHCEDPAVAGRLWPSGSPASRPQMSPAHLRLLAAAGMTVGFHTLHHCVLPLLGEAGLSEALTDGRSTLEAHCGSPVELVAYPYGRADRRVADAAARAGYRAAFVTGGRAVRPGVDRFLIPRWEPGTLSGPRLAAEALLRLHAPAP
jgi:peptidoglycan/xylan/chitin deacetylase (PgdA/CDA1 family)